ncbi:MAG: leucine-rich repeat protein [Verrucomicrobia bacterium]|nr:leucine-rich repeat protein [Verrucomicrobiota bacterium]
MKTAKTTYLGCMLAGALALIAGAYGGQDVLPSIPKGTIALNLKQIATGLAAPDYAISPPGDTARLFVLEQKGQILILQNGRLLPTPALDIQSLVAPPLVITNANDERGLLGLAFHPGFSTPISPGYRTLYTYNSQPLGTGPTYVAPNGATQGYKNAINEWKVSATDPNVIDPLSRREVISFGKNANNHNGGTIAFGPDGYLYLGLGDGGNANDVGFSHLEPGGNAQNLSTPLGKFLRIDPLLPTLTPGSPNPASGNGQYRIPATNPFQVAGQVPEIYALGFRNPYRFSFDRLNGELILADVGQNTVEEIDRVVLGGNYGWAIKEGDFLFNRTTATGTVGTVGARSAGSPVGLTDPISGPSGTLEYDHDDGISIIGGFVYRGSLMPELYGKYVFGDLALHTAPTRADARLFYADLTTGAIKEFLLPQFAVGILPNGLTVHGFGEDGNGELYVLATNTPSSGTGGIVYALQNAPVVWNGPPLAFGKAALVDWTLPQNQDRITDSVWLTRASTQGLFNIRTESAFTHSLSPVGTEWAYGTTASYASLTYTDWDTWTGGPGVGPPSTVGRDAVLHLLNGNIYIDIKFTSWGAASGGGFSYVRSTPEMPRIEVEQPSGTSLTSGSSTANFGSLLTGNSVPLTFTIKNTGTVALTGIAVTRDGTNASDYVLTSAPASSVAAGGSSTFVVSFTPSAVGTRTAALHIASNDDPAHNPFNINLTGIGTSAVPPTLFTWASAVAGNWSDATKWTNDQASGTAPIAAGQADYTLNFNAAGTYTATNDLNAGFLLNQLNCGGSNVTLAGNSLALAANGATLPQINQNSASTMTISAPLSLAANLTVGGSGSGAMTVSGVISGTNGLTKASPGTLTLTGANTYGGGTTVYGGTVLLSGPGTLGAATGDLTVNGASARVVLSLPPTSRTVGAVNLLNGGQITGPGTLIATAMNVESGAISVKLAGTGGMTKTTAATVTLSGINTYTGDTMVAAGILAVNGSSINDTNKLTITGGKVQATGTETVASLFFGPNPGDQAVAGSWGASGSGAEHVDDVHFTGSGGVLNVVTGPTRPATSTVLARVAGTNPSEYGAAVTFSVTVSGNAPTGNVILFDGATPMATVALGGSSKLFLTFSTLTGGEHLLLARYSGDGNNAPSDSVAISQTVLAASSAKDILTFVFPGLPATTISGTDIIVTVPFGTAVTALAPSYTVSPSAAGNPAPGTVGNFTTPQSYTVTAQDLSTKVYTVTVTVGPAPTVFTWTSAVTGNWSDAANWTNDQASGTAPIATGQANYTLNFNAAGTYTATNNLNAGFLLNQLNCGGSTVTLAGNGLAFAANGATLPRIYQSSASGVTISNPLSLAADLTVGGTGTGAVTLAGAISGAARLTKASSGTLSLTGVNTYTGDTTVSAGTLVLAGNAGMRFVVTDVSNNKLAGTGTATLNGDFTIDTTAVTVTAGSWPLVEVATLTEIFGATFTVAGFTPHADGVTWIRTDGPRTWNFSESTGMLVLTSDLTYVVTNGAITITGFTGIGDEVSLPGTINGLPVTGIGSFAFYNRSDLRSVTLPAGITSIDDFAFYNCSGLTRVTLPEGINSIGDFAFFGCDSLTHLTLPASVTGIGSYAFAFCGSLTSVVLGSGVTNVGDGAFYFCTGLTNVTIPGNVTFLGESAFEYCSGLTRASFTGNAPALGWGVFDATASGFTVYHFDGATGFAGPPWNGHAAATMGAATPVAIWLLGNALPHNADLQDDPNGDGVSLLLAYALNLDPQQDLSGSLPEPVVAANQLSISFFAGRAGVSYAVESSTDLQHWSSAGVTVSAPDQDQRRTATVNMTDPYRCLRLVVSLP